MAYGKIFGGTNMKKYFFKFCALDAQSTRKQKIKC